jgi:ATP-dependent Lhr-like helicase
MKYQQIEEQITKYIEKVGWSEPTPIQRKAIPVVLRGRHTLIVAPTGSGKTEAAVIPIFTVLSGKNLKQKGVRVLYITPLRALNRDIFRRLIHYAEERGLKADIRHGDTSQYSRQKMVEEPPDVLITTPETLAIILTSRRMRENLRTLEYVVIDELHELIGSERGAHLSVSLERLTLLVGHRVTRIGLSASIGDLEEAGRFLAGEEMKAAVIVDPSIRRYEIELRYVPGSLTDLADSILRYIRNKVGVEKSTILFTNTRDEAEYLGSLMRAKSPDIPIEVHHGSLSREIREDTEKRLREGEAGVVVSTSSLELGLDIGKVDLVVQYGSSRQAVKLVQRIGRSRHQVGESAVGLVVTNRIDDELEALALINRVHAGSFEKSEIHKGALDVLSHHLVGMVMENRSLSISNTVAVIKKAYPFRDTGVEEVNLCFELLNRQGILRYDGEVARPRGAEMYKYYYNNVSMIPDIQSLTVIDRVSNKKVGRLDQMFVEEFGEPGRPFILKGSSWKIISIDYEKSEINVEPLFEDVNTVPYWVGELIPVDFDTVREVGRIRRSIAAGSLTKVSREQEKRIRESQETLGHIPDENSVTVENQIGSGTIVVHSCFGSKVNQTLATLLSTIISSKTGYLVEANSDPYRILLSSQGLLLTQHVTDFFNQGFDIEAVLSVAVIGTHPLNWKTWYVAKKFGVVGKEAQYDKRASRLIQDRYRNTALYQEVLRELFQEKYDIERTKEIAEAVKTGRIKIVEREVKKFSPLAQPILQHASSFAALPISIEKTVLDLVKERLENRKHRLVCMSCGRWESVTKTRDIKEDIISCPICRSRLIAESYPSDDQLICIVKKKKTKGNLTEEEEKRFRRAWKTSSLIQNFGRKAIVTISGFGIGADTAARILRRYAYDDEFYKDIYKAEKTFVANRIFWDD